MSRLLATIPSPAIIPALVNQLEFPRQRQLLACLARRMVTSHRSAGESSQGNAAEQQAFQLLLDLLEQHGGAAEASALDDHHLRRPPG
ncbi:MAG: hypothetical protein ACK486_05305, partial [Cyanobacteriota bacterium]